MGSTPWYTKSKKEIVNFFDRHVFKNRRIDKPDIKMLLLGNTEAGKSTFFKQMRLIHGDNYSVEEKKEFARLVHRNIFNIMRCMIDAMKELKITFANETSFAEAEIIVNADPNALLDNRYLEAIQNLWGDRRFRKCYNDRRKYVLSDSTEYYISNIERIGAPDYLPTEEDILRVRSATTSIEEYHFELREAKFTILDLGGQKTERRKWLHCFENVDAVLFVSALNEYYEILLNDGCKNRMLESLALFKAIVSYSWFKESYVLLFLNKKDLFDLAIKEVHLEEYLPDYSGPSRHSDEALKFIYFMFQKACSNRDSPVYTHITRAIDGDSAENTFNMVKAAVLQRHVEWMERI